MALLLLQAPQPVSAVGAIASAAQRLLRADWSLPQSARPASSSSSPSPSSPPPAPPSSSSTRPPPALSSLYPRSLHRFVPPAPPAVLQVPGTSAVVALGGPHDYNGSIDEPFSRRTLAAAAFALALTACSSVLAEVWREARILRPPRPAPPPLPPQSTAPPAQADPLGLQQQQRRLQRRAEAVAQLESALGRYAAEERALAARLRPGPRLEEEEAGELNERLREARVVRAALERQVEEQRGLLRREEREEARRRGVVDGRRRPGAAAAPSSSG